MCVCVKYCKNILTHRRVTNTIHCLQIIVYTSKEVDPCVNETLSQSFLAKSRGFMSVPCYKNSVQPALDWAPQLVGWLLTPMAPAPAWKTPL